MADLTEILASRKANTADAIQAFDQLAPADLDFMLGLWKGYEINTGHQIDGLLEPSGWFGKLFVNKNEVHPLVMHGSHKSLWALNPMLIPLTMKFPKTKLLGVLVKIFRPFLQTKKSKARLRMVEHRGKITATMIYDNKAIHDHFAKIDDNTVLGYMDLKGIEQPFFWVMERADQAPYSLKFNH